MAITPEHITLRAGVNRYARFQRVSWMRSIATPYGRANEVLYRNEASMRLLKQQPDSDMIASGPEWKGHP